MNRFWGTIKWLLIGWGAVCFVGAIIMGGMISYSLGPGNTNSAQTASKHDVRYVLNWCGLGDERIEEVLHSYASSRSLTGDHLDAHAIRISHVDLSELTADNSRRKWHRGDQATGLMDETLKFVGLWLGDEIPWFPSYEELRSENMYVYPWSIYCHGVKPSAVKLIFVRPKDNMVFFFSCKM